MPTWHARLYRPLVLLGVILSMALLRPATGHAQVKRLEAVANFDGALYHRWSFDGGSTWSLWTSVPSRSQGFPSFDYTFGGIPAVVSDKPGRLNVVAKATNGFLVINSFNTSTNSWTGWAPVGLTVYTGAGGVWAEWGSSSHWYQWNSDSDPAISSWGPGRLDLFMHATRADGTNALVHTWAADGYWQTGDWEVLGSGVMQGSPAAVSDWVGRISVFARANDTLVSKRWDGSRWSAWQSHPGTTITSSPTVAAMSYGELSIWARGGDGHLWEYYSYLWPGWRDHGGFLAAGTSPAVASTAYRNLHVFHTGSDGMTVWQKAFNPSPSPVWSGYSPVWILGTRLATAGWVP